MHHSNPHHELQPGKMGEAVQPHENYSNDYKIIFYSNIQ